MGVDKPASPVYIVGVVNGDHATRTETTMRALPAMYDGLIVPDDRTTLDLTTAYLEAAAFTELGYGDQPDSDSDFAPEAVAQALALCAAFVAAHREDVEDYGVEQAGHDLWFTRNGHGCGFWEEDHGTPESCARLDAAAKRLGGVWLYAGDDGLLYWG